MSDENSARLIRIEDTLNKFVKESGRLEQWKESHEKADNEFKKNVCNPRGITLKRQEKFRIYVYAGCFMFGTLITLLINWTKLDKWFHGG